MAQCQWASAHLVLVRARKAAADPFLKAEIFQKDAEALRYLGRFLESLSCYRKSHFLYKKLLIPSESLSCLLGMSACLRVLGRYGEARRMWARGLPPSLPQVELERALVARGLGRFKETEHRIARALKRLQRKNTESARSDLQHAYWISGGLARFTGYFPKAIKAFGEAARLARHSGDVSAEAFALCGMAGVERILGNVRASLSNYRTAHRLLKKLGDPFGEAYGLCGQANALRTFGEASLSLPLYRRSARLYQRLGDESSEAFAHWGMGGSFRRLNRFPSALAAYKRALRLFIKSKDDRGRVMTHLGLAGVAEAKGHPRAALRQAVVGLAAARRAQLRYETALARYEIGRLRRPDHPPTHLLKLMGISPTVVRRWRDIP